MTKKELKELTKKFVGKRIALDETYNVGDFPKGTIGTITEVSNFGNLRFEADNGGVLYIDAYDKFHEVYNWEL